MRGDGQDLVEDLLLAVAGVDERLAGIRAHGRFDDGGICRVDLQRQRGHARELGAQAQHDRALVDLGKARVDVENLRAGIRLLDGLAHDIVELARAQSLLQALLARGIDALADHAHVARFERHVLLGARHRKGSIRLRGLVAHAPRNAGDERFEHRALLAHPTIDQTALGRRIGRARAAAAAHNGDARLEHPGNRGDIRLGRDVIDRAAALHARETGVSLHHDGAGRIGHHALHERDERRGPQTAVDAERVNPERRERDGGNLGRSAQERAAILCEGHRAEDGQIGVVFGGEHRGLRLGEVGHGLDDEEVCPGGIGSADLLGEELVGLIEGAGAHGGQELACGADVGGNVRGPARLRAGDGCGEDLLDGGGIAQLGGVGTEGVGGHHVGAGLHVCRMDGANLVGIGEAEQLGQLAGGKAALLQLRAHSAVEHEDLLACQHGGKTVILDAEGVVAHIVHLL